jgi:hypothetical protein
MAIATPNTHPNARMKSIPPAICPSGRAMEPSRLTLTVAPSA